MTDIDVTQDTVTVEVVEDTVSVDVNQQVVQVNAGEISTHVLATTEGLGGAHTTSGLTAGQVLRATGATAAAFAAIEAGDIKPAVAAMGTNNVLPRFSTADGLVDSGITDDGVEIAIGRPAVFSGKVTLTVGQLVMSAAVSQLVPGAVSFAVRNNLDTVDNMLIADAGDVTFRATVGGITTLTANVLAGVLSTATQPNVTSMASLATVGTITTGVWDATAIAWTKVNKSGSVLDDIANVTITGIASDEILKWSGVAWVNNTLVEANIASAATLAAHMSDTANPHSVTKAQVGLGVVENTALSTWPGTTNLTTLGTIVTGVWSGTPVVWTKVNKAGSVLDDIANVTITAIGAGEILKWSGAVWINNTLAEAGIASAAGLSAHLADTGNPHSVTKAQVGLSVVENTALSTWPGSTNITTLGTIAVGVWNGTTISSVTVGAVTTHEAALTILESQITDSTILARVASAETIAAIWAFNGGVSGVSAPFTVDSTFLVANLNVELLDGQIGAYYLASDNFTGTEWEDLTDGGGTTLHSHALNDITNPTGNKTFVMTTRRLGFLWTNPGGHPFELEVSGAYSGAVLHIHQHTGNPGPDTYLIKIESTDTDVHQFISIGPAANTEVFCTDVSGDTFHRSVVLSDGKKLWGPGNATFDTNFYRSAIGTLKTDGVFIAAGGFEGALTGNASTATTLETPRDINGVPFDGSTNITITAAAGTLTGTVLNATVVTSSLTGVGTLAAGTWAASVIGEAYGGTGQSTYVLGAILYSDAADSLAKLAGNITVTKKFLTQTGTGSASAAPSWGVLIAGDLPSHTHVKADITDTPWAWADVSKAGSSLADLAMRSAGDLNSGTLPNARLSGAYTGITGLGTLTSLTLSGLLLTVASAAGGAGFRLPHGVAPTSPIAGDVWTTTAGVFVYVNGSTVGPLIDATTADITEVIAGAGLTGGGSSGSVTLDVIGTVNRITVAANSIDIASTYVGQTSITTVGALGTGSITSAFGNIDIGASTLNVGATTLAGALDMGTNNITNVGTLTTGGNISSSSTGLITYIVETTDTTGRAWLEAQASHVANVSITLRAHGTTYNETLLGLSMTGAVILLGSPKANGMAIGTNTNYPLIFGTANTKRLEIAAGGAADFQGNAVSMGALAATTGTFTGDVIIRNAAGLVIGHSSQLVVGGNLTEFQMHGTGGVDTRMVLSRFSNNVNSPQFRFLKSRASIGSFSTIVTGDFLGILAFFGDDGTDYATAGASIQVISEGTIAVNRIPTKMVFLTGTDASPTVITAALTLDSSQDATFANSVVMGALTATSGVLTGDVVIGSGAAEVDGLTIRGTSARLYLDESDASANNGLWDVAALSGRLDFRTLNDVNSAVGVYLSVARTGITIDTVTFPNGNVLIGATTAATGTPRLDVVDEVGVNFVVSDSETNNADKGMRCGVRHYSNAALVVAAIFVASKVSSSELNLGGGTSLMNAVTVHRWYTAANTTTTTGTLAADITGVGAGSLFHARGSVQVDIGLQMGSPTGGDKGAGTINVAGDIYKNNSAYTNPDYVFTDKWKGHRTGAPVGWFRRTLAQLQTYAMQWDHLPGVNSKWPMGTFARGDWVLEKMEEAYLHLFDHEDRITYLERENVDLRHKVTELELRLQPAT